MKKLGFVLLILVSLSAGLTQFSAVQAQDEVPTKADLTPNEWNAISPGGETTCARGDDYTFFVRPGDESKLMIHFQGGGACWEEGNCAAGPMQTFKDVVMPTPEEEGLTDGIFDFENPDNPAADFTTVAVTYCTGDIHVGDSVMEYGETEIHHNGVNNAQTVLDWVYANYPDPSQVFVNGCSAGSYGSIFYAPSIANAYPNALFAQLGDAGIGVVMPDFEGLETWGFFDTVDLYVPELAEMTMEGFDGTVLYEAASTLEPDKPFAEYTSLQDSVQTMFYQLMGGDGEAWSPNAQGYLDELDALPNFNYYTATGDQHCIIPLPEFYEVETNGTPLVDWVRALMNGEPTETVSAGE